MNLGNGGESKISFLQAHAASFEYDDGAGGHALAVIVGGQFQCARNFGAAHFSEAPALKCALDRQHHRRLSVDFSLADHYTVIGLCDHTLARQPRRGHTLEGVDELAETAGIEERADPGTSIELRETVAINQAGCATVGGHGRPLEAVPRSISKAWATRRPTTPGVAPKSLISISSAGRVDASILNRRSSWACHTRPKPSTEVVTR